MYRKWSKNAQYVQCQNLARRPFHKKLNGIQMATAYFVCSFLIENSVNSLSLTIHFGFITIFFSINVSSCISFKSDLYSYGYILN